MEPVDFLTQEVTRLIGEVKGKKMLELGLASHCLSAKFVAQGASPILVEESSDKVSKLRNTEEFNEFKFEIRQTKLADLAFCPAESIDIAFSIIALAGTSDIARVFRQLQRVLKDQGTLIFGLIHPLAFMNLAMPNSESPLRYRSKATLVAEDLKWDFPVPLPEKFRQISFGETFSLLKRAGLAVDQLLEIPEEDSAADSGDPSALLIKARK